MQAPTDRPRKAMEEKTNVRSLWHIKSYAGHCSPLAPFRLFATWCTRRLRYYDELSTRSGAYHWGYNEFRRVNRAVKIPPCQLWWERMLSPAFGGSGSIPLLGIFFGFVRHLCDRIGVEMGRMFKPARLEWWLIELNKCFLKFV